MDLHVHLTGRSELARQIHQQIRDAILSGRLVAGDHLPPTRELAHRLGVSRNTVTLAYEWLVAEDLAAGQKGAGTVVKAATRRPAEVKPSRIRVRTSWRSVTVPSPAPRPRFDFGVGSPDSTLFPFDELRRLVAREMRGTRMPSSYLDPAGHPALREAIARHVSISRGVRAAAEDVIVTNGAQHAFDLIARLLARAGTDVAIENPGYPPVRMLFESVEANVHLVPLDESGLVVAKIPGAARIVYVTPSHQFPMGMPMSLARRAELLEWANRRKAVIIEDDYDSEFRFGGRPLETLQASDSRGRVLYVGSLSKSMFPALRLGFIVAPPPLVTHLRAASFVSGWFAQWALQAAVAKFIEKGLLDRHLRKMRKIYAERHQRIVSILENDFARWLTPVEAVTGLHVAAPFRHVSRAAEERIAERAMRREVAFDRLSNYWAGRNPRPGLVLGYGGIATEDIEEGLGRLREAVGRG